VDYCSDVPIKLQHDKVKVVRFNEKSIWNKAHAINIGFKKSKGDFIMTMDADILLSPDFFEYVGDRIDYKVFLYTNKVKRIKREHLTDEQIVTIQDHENSKSFKDHVGDRGERYHCDCNIWAINVHDETIEGYTSMDNFDMYNFLTVELGINPDYIKVERDH